MIADTAPDLNSFADWIRATDSHAAHHLSVLEKVGRALQSAAGEAGDECRRLAGKLERWRYQHLNEHAGELTAQDEAFVDALDLAAWRVVGAEARPPRHTRHAVRNPAFDSESTEEALAALDPRFPLQQLIREAARRTQQHFGAADPSAPIGPPQEKRRMLLYAPVYVASECVNHCAYCGFRYPLSIARRHLTVGQAVQQSRVLRDRGHRHLLIVGGDFPSRTTTAYYAKIIRALVQEGIEPAIEIAPQSTESYAELVAAGACGVTLYQETYTEQLYRKYHTRGPKSSYHWRLEAHDRAAEAGMPRLGLGILLGLSDPREDLLAMMRHAAYLADRFPDRTLAFSLPRIHGAPKDFHTPRPVTDEELTRLYCALRIAFPSAELVLSTREPALFRDRLAKTCITQMSAGSSTAPGGYLPAETPAGQQFPVFDHRTPAEVAGWLREEGFRVCWSIEEAAARPPVQQESFGG
jgi:2-iminoacetate synthase